MAKQGAKTGCKEALRSIGLLDDDTARDIIEMRSLLVDSRAKRKSGWSTVVNSATVALLTFIEGARRMKKRKYSIRSGSSNRRIWC